MMITQTPPLRILSDLHLEVCDFAVAQLPGDEETILVLAGDIAPFTLDGLLRNFLEDVSRQFKAVIYVPGNHEYYGGTFPESYRTFGAQGLPENVHMLDRQSVKIDGVTFLGATLWTDFDKADPIVMMMARQCMNDYRMIRTLRPVDEELGQTSALIPLDTLKEHQHARQWLEKELNAYHARARDNDRVVVILHHAPSPQSITPMFAGDALNGAFVSDLEGLFFDYPPNLVIHGHVHSSHDYLLPADACRSVRVVANPRGYAKKTSEHPENEAFSPVFTVSNY